MACRDCRGDGARARLHQEEPRVLHAHADSATTPRGAAASSCLLATAHAAVRRRPHATHRLETPDPAMLLRGQVPHSPPAAKKALLRSSNSSTHTENTRQRHTVHRTVSLHTSGCAQACAARSCHARARRHKIPPPVKSHAAQPTSCLLRCQPRAALGKAGCPCGRAAALRSSAGR